MYLNEFILKLETILTIAIFSCTEFVLDQPKKKSSKLKRNINNSTTDKQAETSTTTKTPDALLGLKMADTFKKPNLLIMKKFSTKRAQDIVIGLENVRSDLLQLIGKLKQQNIDKRKFMNEIENIRRILRKITVDDERVSTIQEIKEKHFSLTPRLFPIIKRSITAQTKPEDNNFNVIPFHHLPFSVITQPPELIDDE